MGIWTTLLAILALGMAYYLGFSPRVKVPGKIVATKNGKVQGTVSKSRDGQDFYEWLGIPFGKVPLRFATALPADPWQGIKDAREYGPMCYQLDLNMDEAGEEDCLFINVFIPKDVVDSGKLVPTMVFTHGGGFAKTSSNMNRPEYFMDEPVAIVTFNYRLGPFGFLNSGDKNSRGNMGLKDQSLALKWVKDNIRYFGGDPDRITLFGVSAGSASTHFHLFSPMSKGLMSQIICQSGVVLNPWSLNLDPVGQAQYLARLVNCPTENSKEMVDCLRARPAKQLLFSLGEFLGPRSLRHDLFVPTIESVEDEETFLSRHPQELLESGNFSRIPMMVGTTSEEGLMLAKHYLMEDSYREYIQNEWNVYVERALFLFPHDKKHGQEIRDFYFGTSPRLDIYTQTNFENVRDLMTDGGFLKGTIDSAVAHSKYSPVYLYSYGGYGKFGYSCFDMLFYLAKKLPLLLKYSLYLLNDFLIIYGLGSESLGACHGDDIIPLFYMPGLFYVSKNDPMYGFSKDMVKLWVDFAYDHTSMKFRGEAFLPMKTEGTEAGIKVLHIQDRPRFHELSANLQKRLHFWKSLH